MKNNEVRDHQITRLVFYYNFNSNECN